MRVLASWSSALLLTLALAACGDDTGTGGSATGAGGEGAGPAGAGGLGAGGAGGIGGEGGQGGAPLMAPPLRNPVFLDDYDLALQALTLMGAPQVAAPTPSCSQCHSINRGLMDMWLAYTDVAAGTCFANPGITSPDQAAAAVACMRQDPGDPNSPWMANRMGIYAAAADLPWFSFVFEHGVAGDWQSAFGIFKQTVLMPKIGTSFTQAEFDIVAEWFARGLPLVADFLPDEPPPTDCMDTVGPEVGPHVAAMVAGGWRQLNLEHGVLMHGCAGAPDTLSCLASYPTAASTSYGVGWDVVPSSTIRILRENSYSSSFWTRSSADGRFVAHGGGQNGQSTIIDLATNTEIAAQAAYDPGFFPDNSGFVFQGTSLGAGVCRQSLLGSGDTDISFLEPECNGTSSFGLYQHQGASLAGGDYWVVDSYFVSDDGGHAATLDNPATVFDGSGVANLTPMIYDGSDYVPGTGVLQSLPYEGDVVISPSSTLLISRVADVGFAQSGLRLRKLNITPTMNGYTVDTPEIGRYCLNGGKPAFSFDERWIVLHRYVTASDAVELGFANPADPGFQPYLSQGAANLWLINLETGQKTRITNVEPGQYALFPHFRSDGWIYFVVRHTDGPGEYVAASDAALVLEP